MAIYRPRQLGPPCPGSSASSMSWGVTLEGRKVLLGLDVVLSDRINAKAKSPTGEVCTANATI